MQGKYFKPVLFLLASAIIYISCQSEQVKEKLISFPSGTWPRFEILSFGFPMSDSPRTYDIVLEIKTLKNFEYDSLPMNMVLNSPSGEERIREFTMEFRNKKGQFMGQAEGDSCIFSCMLKKDLSCSGKGMLKVAIENLNPRIQTDGIVSASVRLVPK